MPYTNPWTDNVPLGGDLAGPAPTGIAAQLQRLKLDVQERMSDLVVDWFADPVQIDTTVSALSFSKFYDLEQNPITSATIKAVLILSLESGFTDGNGRFDIDFSLLAENWNVSTVLLGILDGPFWNMTVNDVAFLGIFDIVGDVVTFEAKFEDGGLCTGDEIQGRLVIFFSSVPV